jgi:hypothetical protein
VQREREELRRRHVAELVREKRLPPSALDEFKQAAAPAPAPAAAALKEEHHEVAGSASAARGEARPARPAPVDVSYPRARPAPAASRVISPRTAAFEANGFSEDDEDDEYEYADLRDDRRPREYAEREYPDQWAERRPIDRRLMDLSPSPTGKVFLSFFVCMCRMHCECALTK